MPTRCKTPTPIDCLTIGFKCFHLSLLVFNMTYTGGQL